MVAAQIMTMLLPPPTHTHKNPLRKFAKKKFKNYKTFDAAVTILAWLLSSSVTHYLMPLVSCAVQLS